MVIERSHANKYDKVLKENMEYVLPGIVKHILELDIVYSEEISHDLQYTKEREPDVLRKVTDQDNRTYILHVELQSQNEKDMVFRMVEYRVMLQRKYRLPVKQYVLYVGKDRLTMLTGIDEENFKFRYDIISLRQVNYKIFLESKLPEEKILAVLGNFGEDNPKEVTQAVIDGVRETADGELAESRYLNQLRVLVQLRKLDIKIDDMIDTTTFFREEDDFLYVKGERKGEARGEINGELKAKKRTALFLKKKGLDINLIAEAVELPVQTVKSLRGRLPKRFTNNN